MANCLRRNFKSYSSFALIGRRHQQTSCFDQKTTNALSPILKEVAVCDYFPLTVPRSANTNPRVLSTLQVSRLQWKDINSIYHLKDLSCGFDHDANRIGLKHSQVNCARECKAYKDDQQELENPSGRPNKEQLDYISKVLAQDLPLFFTKSMNFRIYHPNIVFENNIKGIKTVGIFSYIKEIALLKIICHLKFAKVKLQVLKITVHPEDGTVRARWRITGISNFKAFFQFFKSKNVSKEVESEIERWYDGFSVFYVKSDGLVHKHIVDKMMPDSAAQKNLTDNLAMKVAFALGIAMKDFSTNSISLEEMEEICPQLLEILHPLELLEYFSNRSNSHLDTQTRYCDSSQDN